MKYEIVDKVSRSVKRFGMIMDPETMNKARDEADEYDFRLISEGHYGVIHGSKMYIIIERDGRIGCSCEDMTYNHMDGSVCKHIIAFSRLMSPVVKAIDDADKGFLVNVCGWTGKELHPEIELGGPGARIQEDMRPEPEGQKADPTPKDAIPPDPDLDLGVDDPLPEPEQKTPIVPIDNTTVEPEPQKEEKKMNNIDKPAWNQEAWDSAAQGSFATFDENGVAVVIFTANDFEIGKPDKWGRTTYEFSVIQNNTAVILSIGAMRLMAALKSVLPLEGMQIKITRIGEGMGTQYKVEDVTDTEVI